MKKLLLAIVLIVGCAVNLGHNPILTLNIATKHSEKWCLKECEKYEYFMNEIAEHNDRVVLSESFKNLIYDFTIGIDDPYCVCMHDCTKNENWCEDQREYWSPVDSTVTEE